MACQSWHLLRPYGRRGPARVSSMSWPPYRPRRPRRSHRPIVTEALRLVSGKRADNDISGWREDAIEDKDTTVECRSNLEQRVPQGLIAFKVSLCYEAKDGFSL